jgi:CubicO group peptidase (beta-lactamase class C family)
MKKKDFSQVVQFLTLVIILNTIVFTIIVQAETEIVKKNESWEISTPEGQGMDSKVLDELKTHINKNYPDIYSMVIIRNGFLVEEEYFSYTSATKRNIYSCTKSFTSALIGIAIQEGYIESIDEPVLDFFPNKTFANNDDRKQNMTLYHLLTMTTGLEWNEANYDDPNNPLYLMWESADWVQYVLDLKMVDEPGKTFSYNTGASHVMSAIINYTTGMRTSEYANSRLFSHLSINDYTWPTDPNGINKGGEGLELTPRSLTKLGQLYLDNGSWKGNQIVPEKWVIDSTNATFNPPKNNYYGYGFQWWLQPGDIFSAWGYAHQRVIVVPEYQVVATFTSYMPTISGDPATNLVNEYVLPAIFTHENYEEPSGTSDNTTTMAVFVLPVFLIIVLIRKNQRN